MTDKNVPLGKIVISDAFHQDSAWIQLIAEGNDVANAYFQMLKKPRPAGLKFEKLPANDPMFGKVMHAELHIRRQVFLAAYAENMGMMYFAERDPGVEVDV